MFRAALTALALSAAAPCAMAGGTLPGPDASLCDTAQLDPEAVMGDGWTMTVSRFRIRTEETPAYTSEIKRLPVRLYVVDGAFRMFGMVAPLSPVTFVEMPFGQGVWRWSGDPVLTLPDDPEAAQSSADVEAALGCTLSRFPRLAAQVETVSDDGRQFTHTIWLVALSADLMLGAWDWRTRDDGPEIHYTAGLRLARTQAE